MIISLTLTPILSRVYPPSEYGNFTVFSSIMSIMVLVSTFGYSKALLFSSEEDIIPLVVLNTIIILLFGIFVGLLIIIGNRIVLPLLKLGFLQSDAWIIPLFITFFSLLGIVSNYFIRTNDFRKHVLINNFQNLIARITAITFGLVLTPTAFGLIVGQVIGYFGNLFLYFKRIITKTIVSLKSSKQINFFLLFKKYKNYPLYILPSDLLGFVNLSVPVIIFAYVFQKSDIGQYAFASSLLGLPVNYLSQSFGKTLTQKSMEYYPSNVPQFQLTIERTVKVLLTVTFIPYFVIVLFGENIFRWFLGSQWSKAGVFSQVMAIYYFARAVGGPIINVLNALRKEKLVILFHSTFVPLSLVTIFISSWWSHNMIVVFWSISAIDSIFFAFIILMTLKLTNISFRKLTFQFILLTAVLALISYLKQ